MAAAAGGSDHPRTRRELSRSLVARLTQIPIQVSADIEDGYTDDPREVAAYVAALPITGIDLADSSPQEPATVVPVARQVAKIAAIKSARPDIFVNAGAGTHRTDRESAIGSIIAQAAACIEAGADGIFVPTVFDPAEIRAVTTSLGVPVTVHIDTGLSLQDLADLGVRRVNTGSLPYRAAMDRALSIATSLRDGIRTRRATSAADLARRLRRARSQVSSANQDIGA